MFLNSVGSHEGLRVVQKQRYHANKSLVVQAGLITKLIVFIISSFFLVSLKLFLFVSVSPEVAQIFPNSFPDSVASNNYFQYVLIPHRYRQEGYKNITFKKF